MEFSIFRMGSCREPCLIHRKDFNNNLNISVFRIHWDTKKFIFIFFLISITTADQPASLCYCSFPFLKFTLCKESESSGRVLILIPLWPSSVQFILFYFTTWKQCQEDSKICSFFLFSSLPVLTKDFEYNVHLWSNSIVLLKAQKYCSFKPARFENSKIVSYVLCCWKTISKGIKYDFNKLISFAGGYYNFILFNFPSKEQLRDKVFVLFRVFFLKQTR